MSDNIMAAAQGMLNLFSSIVTAPQPKTPLTTQVPDIQITRPSEETSATNSNGKRRASESQDQKPAKRVAPNPVLPVDPKTHFERKYITIKHLGFGDNGDTFAAILKSDLVDLAAKSRGPDSIPGFFDAIRSKLVAVKFARPDNQEGDLTGEIQFLTEKFPFRHPSINYWVDSHLDGDCQWLALPYASGGSLQGFIEKCSTDLTLSFRWHVAEQMIQALLFLFFGVEDANTPPLTVPEWHKVVHRDIFTGNTLLGTPAAGDPTGFPSCIIADFGRADSMMWMFPADCDCEVCPHRLPNTREQQQADINQLGNVLHELTQIYLESANPCAHGQYAGNDVPEDKYNDADGMCARCAEVVIGLDDPWDGAEALFRVCYTSLQEFQFRKEDFSDAYQLLLVMLGVAKQAKTATFRPMSAAATNRLSTPYVSDRDLRAALGMFNRPTLKPKSRKPNMRSAYCEGQAGSGAQE